MSTSDASELTIEALIRERFSDKAAQAVLDMMSGSDRRYQRYGGIDLRRGHYDDSLPYEPEEGTRGVSVTEGNFTLPGFLIDLAEEQPPTISVGGYVARLQFDLRVLGFKIIREVDGVFGPHTEQAVREFQIYAGMETVAQEDLEAEGEYVERLTTAENPRGSKTHYGGSFSESPISGVVNEETRACLIHWLNEGYRCPVVVTARTGDNHESVYNGSDVADGADPENLWRYDDVQSADPNVFAVDFTGYYDVPTGGGSGSLDFTQNGNGYITLGEYNSLGGYEGPALKESHAWDEAEITPQRLTGTAEGNLTEAEESTYEVIRAVADIECNGYLDSLNAYDNAVISAGPFHWTLTGFYDREGDANDQIAKGELCAFLAYLRSEYGDVYERYFNMNTFGIRPSGEWGDNGEDPFDSTQRTYTTTLERRVHVSDGTVETKPMPLLLDDMTIEEGEVEWLYFRNWHWFYRFVMASRLSEGFWDACWDFARLRFPSILEGDWPEAPTGADWSGLDWTADATVGDVFTSERAVAMLLRWHVYRPFHISSGGPASHRRLEDIFEQARLNQAPHLDWEQDPSNWGDEYEAALITAIEDQAVEAEIFDGSQLQNIIDNENLLDGSNSFDFEELEFNIDYLR